MSELARRLEDAEIDLLIRQIHEDWSVAPGPRRLHRRLATADFKGSLELANRIGELADQQNHHPDLRVSWGRLEIEIWTHSIGSLSESDFVLAAKIDEILAG